MMNPDLASVQLSDFQYELPDEQIARYPVEPRDHSKLLVYNNQAIRHYRFDQLPSLVPSGALLVFNNTKVIPARAHFRKVTGAIIEILFLSPLSPTSVINDAMLVEGACVWECMIGNKKRFKKDDLLESTIKSKGRDVLLTASYEDYELNKIRLSWNQPISFLEIIEALGKIPLPPYLNRDSEERDQETYQTVYALHNGAVAAPTAGLHFTEKVLSELQSKGVHQAFVTLHVGAGTFQPIKVENISEHKMHNEQVVYNRDLVLSLLAHSEKIIPVGTTSMRSLESLYWIGQKISEGDESLFVEKLLPYSRPSESLLTPLESLRHILTYMERIGKDEITCSTEIFIFPGYDFKFCKGLITNYHQPGSTLILLVAAFTNSNWRAIYQEALKKEYRFLSYGDSSLIWRN